MSLSKGEGLLGEQLTAFINKTTKKHGGVGGQLCEPKETVLRKTSVTGLGSQMPLVWHQNYFVSKRHTY